MSSLSGTPLLSADIRTLDAKPEARRWLVLLIFSWIEFNQGPPAPPDRQQVLCYRMAGYMYDVALSNCL